MIIFKSEKARNFLFNNGELITYRVNRRRDSLKSQAILPNRGSSSVGSCYVKLISVLGKDIRPSLSFNLRKSGFDTVEEWIKEIKKLFNYVHEPEFGYLYKVILIKRF